jgi:DegV family protein with EDD domain
LEHFIAAKESGDELVAILLSSGLSGTVQSAIMAKEIAEYDGIHIVDSLTAVTGLRMIVDIACEMRDRDAQSAEIIEMAEGIKSRVRIIAVVDTLEYLHKGGRLTKAQAMIGELANLKILIYISKEGKVTLLDKCIGRERASRKLLGYFEADERDEDYPIYFPYSRYAENCKKLFGTVQARYPDTKEQFFNLGPTIGTHIGENAFGLTYILK